jgi:hypothetical protein
MVNIQLLFFLVKLYVKTNKLEIIYKELLGGGVGGVVKVNINNPVSLNMVLIWCTGYHRFLAKNVCKSLL